MNLFVFDSDEMHDSLLICSGVHLHELLEGSDVHLPEPAVPPRVIAGAFHGYMALFVSSASNYRIVITR